MAGNTPIGPCVAVGDPRTARSSYATGSNTPDAGYTRASDGANATGSKRGKLRSSNNQDLVQIEKEIKSLSLVSFMKRLKTFPMLSVLSAEEMRLVSSLISNIREIDVIKALPKRAKLMTQCLPKIFHQNLYALRTTGDGNCLFNAVSQTLFGSEKYQSLIRFLTGVVMLIHENLFKHYVQIMYCEKTFYNYVIDAFTDGVWGSDIHIHAISLCVGRPITVISDRVETDITVWASLIQNARSTSIAGSHTYSFSDLHDESPKPLHILHSNSNHFSAIIPKGESSLIFPMFLGRWKCNIDVYASDIFAEVVIEERRNSRVTEIVDIEAPSNSITIMQQTTQSLKNITIKDEQNGPTQPTKLVSNGTMNKQKELSSAAKRMRKLRSQPDYYEKEKEKNKIRNNAVRRNKSDAYQLSVENFLDSIKHGPTHICCICNNTWFKHSIKRTNKAKLVDHCAECAVLEDDRVEICLSCYKTIKQGHIPVHSALKGIKFPEIPAILRQLSNLEERLIAPRIPFMTIRNVGCDRQYGLKGAVVNVPVDVCQTVAMIPRQYDELGVIEVNLKRKLQYKHSYCSEMIRPNVVFEAASYLCEQSLYKKHEICLGKVPIDTEAPVEQHEPETQSEELNPGNSETLLCQPDYRVNIAPGEGNVPLNVIYDDDCEALCFPGVYGGVEDPFKNLSVSDRVKYKARHVDRRCAKIPVLFFMYKLQESHRLSQIIGICIRRRKQNVMNAGDCLNDNYMSDMYLEDSAYKFMKGLRSSPAYWESKKKDVFAMIRQLGLPTLFMTFSAAESKWKPLIVILKQLVDSVEITEDDVANMPYAEKARLIRSDPITCARYFENKFRNFMHKILLHKHGIFKEHPIKDYYVRFEFQHRGSVHAHLIVWLDDAPIYKHGDQNSIAECSKFIDKFAKCQSSLVNEDLQKYQTHKHTFTCRKNTNEVCRFNIPYLPMRSTTILEPNGDKTARKTARNKVKHFQKLLEEVAFSSMEHFLEVIKSSYEEYLNIIRQSLTRPKVFLQRQPSEFALNPYNPDLLNLYQANMDIQFITDAYACVSYVVDYINKSNRGMSEMLRVLSNGLKKQPISCIQKLRTLASKFMNATEVSAQEAAYHVLELPLTMSSRSVEYINTGEVNDRVRLLKAKKVLEDLDPMSEDVYAANSLVHYSNRPNELENVCLSEFVAKYTYSTKKTANGLKLLKRDGYITPRRVPKVIRYRRYTVEDEFNYRRESLLLFVPWRNEEADIPKENIDQLYEANSENIDLKRQEYEKTGGSLQGVERDECNESDEDDESQEPIEYCAFQKDPAMLPESREKSHITFKRYNIEETGFINMMKQLNPKQYNYALNLWHHLSRDEKVYHFISGGAGTGKSVLINAIAALTEKFYKLHTVNELDRCRAIITAPTGRAAFNVSGYTLHTAFMIPVSANDNNFSPLSSDTLSVVRNRMRGLKLLIIDEVSMVGASLFDKVNQRLQQIFQSNDMFGGISVVVVGDFNQLQPVLDRYVFMPNKRDPYAEIAGNHLWELFDHYRLTDIMRQKDDFVFANLLQRFANRSLTAEDHMLLMSRTGITAPTEAIHLFHTNREVDSFNQLKLLSLHTEGILSLAKDSCYGEAPKQVKDSFVKSLENSKLSETQGLPFSVLLKLSAKYMITENIDVEDGLVNGAVGILKHITYSECGSRGIIAWLQLDNGAGEKQRQKFRHLFVSHSDLTPVFTVTKLITNKGYSRNLRLFRKQFPLIPAEAMTVHKSQGGTYDSIVYHAVGRRSHAASYVALSRVTSLNGLFIDGMVSLAQAPNTKVCDAMKRISKKPAATTFDHLCSRGIDSFKIINFNIQSFKNHIHFVENDVRLSNADVLCLTETWLISTDAVNIPGFSVVGRLDCETTRKPAGVLVLAKPEARFTIKQRLRTQVVDKYAVESVTVSNENYVLMLIYAAPKTGFCDLENHLSQSLANVKSKKVIVMGDFNLNIKEPVTKSRLLSIFGKYGCRLIASDDSSTQYGSQIDYAFGRNINTQSEYYQSLASYHRPQVISVIDRELVFLRRLDKFVKMLLIIYILFKDRLRARWLIRRITQLAIQGVG